jgi:hypothetical protein
LIGKRTVIVPPPGPGPGPPAIGRGLPNGHLFHSSPSTFQESEKIAPDFGRLLTAQGFCPW